MMGDSDCSLVRGEIVLVELENDSLSKIFEIH